MIMEIVPFLLAKKLKEKGFPQHITDDAYIVDNYGEDAYDIGDRLPIPLIPDYMDDVAAPTISQVLKWLREKDVMVEIIINLGDNGVWQFAFRIQTKKFYERATKYDYTSYESAALFCIEYIVDNLI